LILVSANFREGNGQPIDEERIRDVDSIRKGVCDEFFALLEAPLSWNFFPSELGLR
jgi:hypothetical protein